MTVRDSHERRLDAAEREMHDRVEPALRVWTAYLDRVAAVQTWSEAEAREAPMVARHRPPDPRKLVLYKPYIVCPQWALNWAQRNGMGGLAGTGSPLTYGQLVDALDFMRADRAVTFRPAGEARGCRRRDGFFHLQHEIVGRIRQARYVPVLTRRPGRPLRNDRIPAGHTTRALRRATGDHTLTIVRDWLRTTETTALLATARDQGRPLAVRPPGRPRTSAAAGAQVATAYVVGTAEALAAHGQGHSDRLGIRAPSTGELAAALAAAATVDEGKVLAPITRFSTVDAPQQRNLRGWWRFNLLHLSLPEVSPGDLLGEVEHYLRTRDRVPVDPEPTRRRFVLPPDCDPQWLDDIDYRLMHKITDEQYEAWKAGL